eukprot:SAG25_NODE_3_length_30426_cov_8.268210_38_plen_49_part_00
MPRKWVMPTELRPQLVWNDAGTGGRPGSLWTVNEYLSASSSIQTEILT